MKDNNQIIVYGGTGFYGQKVVEKLVEKKQSVKVVVRHFFILVVLNMKIYYN